VQEVKNRRVDVRIAAPCLRHRPVEITPVGILLRTVHVDIGAVDREAGNNLLESALQDVAVKSAVTGFWRATRPASRPSTLSSLAISFSMMRILHSRTICENGVVMPVKLR
jgi:hypothetical protein